MTHIAPLYPAALKKGNTIGIIAPSSHTDLSALSPAVNFLEQNGFKVIFHPQTALKHGQMAGTESQRVDGLHDFFENPDIQAIFTTCGGNGAVHLLDKIDYGLIKKNPKIFMGFSDITLLLNAITAKTGLVTFHGPTLTRIKKIQPHWNNQMIDVLSGAVDYVAIKSDYDVQGRLYGGNLSVMQALIGTPFAPDMTDAVLMLEDINDHLSRYDRMMGHMKQAGWINALSAIILGEFLQSQDNPKRPFGFSIEEIAQNNAPDTPLITDAPFGHGDRLCTLPIGADIVLKNGKLSFKSLA